ncbi:hypothetical protein RYX36_029309 [Vicia faba]
MKTNSMKFGKSLSSQIEKTLQEWRDQFLSYEELKKKLKNLERPPPMTTVSRNVLGLILVVVILSLMPEKFQRRRVTL